MTSSDPLTPLARQAADRARPPLPGEGGQVVRHYDIPEVAALLSIGRSSVYELIADGHLKARILPATGPQRRRRMRVRADDLQAFTDGLEDAPQVLPKSVPETRPGTGRGRPSGTARKVVP